MAGASEPPFLGVAIGHNERIAWGLTIVGTDQQDVYVEELNPANHERGEVERQMGVDSRRPRGDSGQGSGARKPFEMKFTPPRTDLPRGRARHRAYVLRSALHEPGTAPYLAGLRLSQAARLPRRSSRLPHYWNAPSENLICGDVDGNISWRASALTPARKGWSGRLPVPGTGDLRVAGVPEAICRRS